MKNYKLPKFLTAFMGNKKLSKKPKFFTITILCITIIGIISALMLNPSKEIDSSNIVKSNEENNKKENVVEANSLTNLNKDEVIERLVYNAVSSKIVNKNQNEFTIITPKIFESYEEENKIKIFSTVYVTSYIMKDKILELNMGSNIPTAITYSKDENNNYILEEYIESREGSEFSSSIKEFCTMPISKEPINDLADEIINQYSDNEYFQTLERNNLIKYLEDNNIKGASLLEKYYGEEKLIPLT